MSVVAEDIRGLYDLFNAQDIDALVGRFGDDAVYNQLNTDQTAVGRDQIRQVMEGWRTFFEGAQVTDVQVQPITDDRFGELRDATQCFLVDFVGTGRYATTIPGLEAIALARGQEVKLPLQEVIWLNADGELVRVDNSFQADALQ